MTPLPILNVITWMCLLTGISNRLSLKLRGESETDIVYAATPYPGTYIRKRVESIGATLDMIEDKRQLSIILQLPLS